MGKRRRLARRRVAPRENPAPVVAVALAVAVLAGIGLLVWGGSAAMTAITGPTPPTTLKPSGATWVKYWPTGKTTATLAQPFRGNLERFITAIEASGGQVHITATLRPRERAYLMHFCYAIAVKGADPASVPPMAGVLIDWVAGGRAGAAAMNAAYGQVSPGASLTSNHIEGNAVDMSVVFPRATTIDGIAIPAGDGNMSAALWSVGDAYGVHKLKTDHPHWSSTGK